MENLGEKLRKEISDRGLSKSEVAEALGIPGNYIGRKERGESKITAEDAAVLYFEFGINLLDDVIPTDLNVDLYPMDRYSVTPSDRKLEDRTSFFWPLVSEDGKYKAFKMLGDTMGKKLSAGSVIICENNPSPEIIQDEIYFIVFRDGTRAVKRMRTVPNGEAVSSYELTSDNENIQPMVVEKEYVKENLRVVQIIHVETR